jgi:hypothetical protein
MALGQERYDEALAAFRKSRSLGFTGSGEYYARAYDALGRHSEADAVYFGSTGGRVGWHDDGAVVTWIDRGQPQKVQAAIATWLASARKNEDVVDTLRARAAITSLVVLSGEGDATSTIRDLLAAARTNARQADAIFPPMSVELQLYAGLLAAHAGDRTLLADALSGVRDSTVVRDYPTVAQLHLVLLAEQDRLSGKSDEALARLRPLARQDSALVAVHWALANAEQAAGNADAAAVQTRWLATRRGRVLTENTSSDVLRFFNTWVSREASQATPATPASR